MRGGYIGGVVTPTPKPVTARRPVGTLRARLMGLVVGVVVMGWLVGGLATLHGARDAAARGRDARLVQMSHAVLAFARHELAESARDGQLDEADPKDRTHGLDLRYRYQVWRQGRLLVASADSPTDRALAHGAGAGFSESHDGARPQRVYAAPPDPAGLVVQVAEWLDEPGQAMPLPGMAVLVSMAASLLLAVALAGVLLVRVLRMLDAATDSLHRRSPLDAELLDPDTLPAELRPLVEALNQQWSLAAERLSHERGFTALAAHELRTPLAALRMQVQVALRAEEPAARNELLRRVLTSVDRCDHLIDQLLTLARVELGSQDGKASVDLGGLCRRVVDDLGAGPPPRGCRIELQSAPASVAGWAFALEVLVRNLLSNALAHSPDGAVVSLSLGPGTATSGPELVVDDAGPGIAPAQRARVFDRFVRLGAAPRHAGAGLGLSIVRAVADAHGASVTLGDAPQGGLRVSVRFPAAPAGSPVPAP